MDLSAVSSAVSKSAMNIAFFDTQIECLMKNMFLPHISSFCKLRSQNFTKHLKKAKNSLLKGQ
jgi:hypothetical protein